MYVCNRWIHVLINVTVCQLVFGCGWPGMTFEMGNVECFSCVLVLMICDFHTFRFLRNLIFLSRMSFRSLLSRRIVQFIDYFRVNGSERKSTHNHAHTDSSNWIWTIDAFEWHSFETIESVNERSNDEKRQQQLTTMTIAALVLLHFSLFVIWRPEFPHSLAKNRHFWPENAS